jgi:hypothetical protein
MPAADQVEILRRATRYLIAAEQVKSKGKQLNLTDEQRSQLREREATERAAAESALLKLYPQVWLPRIEEGRIAIDAVEFGGRPSQITLNDKKEAMIHERLLELLTTLQRRVFGTLSPSKIVELFKLGDVGREGIRVREVVDGFYSFIGFTRLTSDRVIRRAIAEGGQKGFFGYLTVTGSPPILGPDGRYQVAPERIRSGPAMQEDEIDVDSGVLIAPGAIPVSAPPADVPVSPTAQPGAPPGPPVQGGAPTAGPHGGSPGSSPTVDLSFSGNRNQLYAAWSAVANLADLAGEVRVSLHAEGKHAMDRTKLENGVFEPLREAGLID